MNISFPKYRFTSALFLSLFIIPNNSQAVEIPSPSETISLAGRAKGSAEQNLYAGRLAFFEYDFERAEKLFTLYANSKKKSPEGESLLSEFLNQLEVALESMSHVQELQLISKTRIPEENFFSAIRLPRSAGHLLSPDSIPFPLDTAGASMAFSNEGRDYMLWTQEVPLASYYTDTDIPDSGVNSFRIVESEKLTDGSWSAPVPLEGLGEPGINADFPFLRSDGITLYFSSPQADTMGGYDLFVATRDSSNGGFLTPRNLGMPFNSPFDDLLVAIDETNSLAWLVSDREQVPGFLTIYLYRFEENRRNFDAGTPGLKDHAFLSASEDYLDATSPEYLSAMNALANLDKQARSRRPDFEIAMPGRGVYRWVENFNSPQARIAATKLRNETKLLNQDQKALLRLRSEYKTARQKANRSLTDNLGARILQLESSIEERQAEIKQLRNQAIQAESSL